jgi:hypothetical protein
LRDGKVPPALFRLDGEEFVRSAGGVEVCSVGATVEVIAGPGLRVTWEDGSADVVV